MKNKSKIKEILKEIQILRVEIAEKSDRLKELQEKLRLLHEKQ